MIYYMMYNEKWTYSLKITYWETTRLSPKVPPPPNNQPIQFNLFKKKNLIKITFKSKAKIKTPLTQNKISMIL